MDTIGDVDARHDAVLPIAYFAPKQFRDPNVMLLRGTCVRRSKDRPLCSFVLAFKCINLPYEISR